jgi:folate-binding protein YgfZ
MPTAATFLGQSGAAWGEVAGCRILLHFGDPRAEYEALTSGVGIAPWLGRTQIEFTGDDRAAFLHNLCTNNVRALRPGQGCEAFITNVQGKTIGHGYLFAGAESLIFDTAPSQAAKLLPHFEKYHLREKVAFRDRAEDWGEVLLAGNGAVERLERSTADAPPQARFDHRTVQVAGRALSLRRLDFCGPATFALSGDAAAVEAAWAALSAAGARPCGHDAVEMARIEAGTPVFGQDITDKNLSQELARDALAISFTKGCYLGQETVARIDALGHVNQTLCGLRFSGPGVPPPGTELSAADKVVAHVTSSAFSPRLNAPLALAYVRRGHAIPGAKLTSSRGEATVVELPLS